MLWPVLLPRVRVGRVADRVGAVAQLDGPVVIGRVEVGDRTHPLTSVAEQRDRGDVLVDTRRQGAVETERADGRREHDVGDRRAQRVAAQHKPGVGATVDHVLDVVAHVVGALRDLGVGGVPHGIGVDGPVHLGSQGADERVAQHARSGRFVAAAGEHDLHRRAGRGARWRGERRRGRKGRGNQHQGGRGGRRGKADGSEFTDRQGAHAHDGKAIPPRPLAGRHADLV